MCGDAPCLPTKMRDCEDETLLVWGNALLVLDLGLDSVNGVAGLDLEVDGLAGQCVHKDFHVLMLV